MYHVPVHQVACDTSRHCRVSCFGHLQTQPEAGVSGTHLFCFLDHGLEVRQRTCEELLWEGFPYTCCCQHGYKVLKFGCSLMCSKIFGLVWWFFDFCFCFVLLLYFGLSVRKLELWTSTLASGDSELCYV